jgi:hypothetical protein
MAAFRKLDVKMILVMIAITVSRAASASASAVATISSAAPWAATKGTGASAGRTLLARSRFVHCERPALEVLLMEHRNGLFGVSRGGHFDERKATGASGGPIQHLSIINN